MTCNLALATALIFSATPTGVAEPAQTAIAASYAPLSLSQDSAFAALISEATRLKQVVDGWMAAPIINDAAFLQSEAYLSFKAQTENLAKADMEGHLTLKERGTDGDLTCILRGIAEDIPRRIANLEAATVGSVRYQALEELAYLLNDNAEVILAPPIVP